MTLKRTFIAFMIVNEVVDESTGEKWPVLKPHDHPVFTGEVAYDLADDQEIQIDTDLNVREFSSPGEALTAVNDYYREVPGEISRGGDIELKQVGVFYLLEQFTANDNRVIRSSKKVSTKKGK